MPDTSGLQDISKRPDHKELSSKGGKSVDPTVRSEAAKRAWVMSKLSRQPLTDDEYDWLLERVKNPDAYAISVMQKIDETCRASENPIHIAQLMRVQTDVMKLVHGEKIKSENVNININTTAEEWERRIYGDGKYEKPKTENNTAKDSDNSSVIIDAVQSDSETKQS